MVELLGFTIKQKLQGSTYFEKKTKKKTDWIKKRKTGFNILYPVFIYHVLGQKKTKKKTAVDTIMHVWNGMLLLFQIGQESIKRDDWWSLLAMIQFQVIDLVNGLRTSRKTNIAVVDKNLGAITYKYFWMMTM